MVQPIPRYEEVLTGETRARPGWFGKQILQVEIRSYRLTSWPRAANQHNDRAGESTTYWRDATWLDVHALSAKGFNGLAPGYTSTGQPLSPPARP